MSLVKTTPLVVGLTGTLFTAHMDSVARVCSSLCLDGELHQLEFWNQREALALACAKTNGIYRPPDAIVRHEASRRPPNPEWRYVTYEKRDISFSLGVSDAVKHICDCIDVSETESVHLHSLKLDVDKKKVVAAFFDRGMFSSKLNTLFDAIKKLFEEGRNKILVSTYYLDVVFIVQEYLRLRFRFDRTVNLFECSGNTPYSTRMASLKSFLLCSNGPETRSVMLATVNAIKNGLNITNGVDSPSAHIEFEQPGSVADRFQLQCRIDREGNPHSVQLVVITGSNTVNERKLKTHIMQSQKRKTAGDDVPESFLSTSRLKTEKASLHLVEVTDDNNCAADEVSQDSFREFTPSIGV